MLAAVAPSVFANSFPPHRPRPSASYHLVLHLAGPPCAFDPLFCIQLCIRSLCLSLPPFLLFAIPWPLAHHSLSLLVSCSLSAASLHHAARHCYGMAASHFHPLSRLSTKTPHISATAPAIHLVHTIRHSAYGIDVATVEVPTL